MADPSDGESPIGDDADREFDALVNRYFDGAATAEEVAHLERQLLADEAFADRVSQWCLMHRQIAELMTESALHEMMDRFVQAAPGPRKELFSATAKAGAVAESPESTAARRSRRRGLLAIIAATAAAVAIAVAIWPRGEAPHVAQNPTETDAAPDGELEIDVTQNNGTPVGAAIIATLTRASNAKWATGARSLHPGDQLSVGDHITLASGMAKVTFECGAEVVLEGPCDFEIHSQMLGYLNSGKITADVPRRAFGFAILSPRVEFVDLGTSFGVEIGADGHTELHVFEGEVLCSPSAPTAGPQTSPIHVQANRAMQFGAGAGPSSISFDAASFAQLMALRRPVDVDFPRLPGDRLALWLAADAAIATDDQRRVVSWQDIIYGDNVSAEDAVQSDTKARPLLVDAGVHGRPAIRFDGESDWLLTTPLETTDNQTVLLVAQFTPNVYEPRRWGGQILNYDGPPSRYLSNLLEPGVLQIGEPLLEEQFKPTLLTAQVFAGFIGRATVEVGRIDAVQAGADEPFLLAYTYDYANRRAELWINGRSFGQERAYAPQGITSRKIIGRHAWMQNFFHGDLAELLIYNQALSPEDLAATTAYLAEKYNIELQTER